MIVAVVEGRVRNVDEKRIMKNPGILCVFLQMGGETAGISVCVCVCVFFFVK